MPVQKSRFAKGQEAVVKATGTLVITVAVFGKNVLAMRADNGLQWTYSDDELMAVEPVACPI